MLRLQPPQSLEQASTDSACVLLETVLFYDIEQGETGRHGDRIATERVEVNAAGECLGDLPSRRDGRKGNAISDAFGHRHDVRNDVVILESPVVLASAAEAGLNFVGDTEAAEFPDDRVRFPEIVRSSASYSSYPLDRLGHEPPA